jgi:hypothetical protein
LRGPLFLLRRCCCAHHITTRTAHTIIIIFIRSNATRTQARSSSSSALPDVAPFVSLGGDTYILRSFGAAAAPHARMGGCGWREFVLSICGWQKCDGHV